MNFIITYHVIYGLIKKVYGNLMIIVLKIDFKIVGELVHVLGRLVILRCLSKRWCCDRVILGSLFGCSLLNL